MSSPYFGNAYRALGLMAGVNRASVMEAHQVLKVRVKAGRLGSILDFLSHFDPIQRDDLSIRDAFYRLELAPRRIVEWLFWFEGSAEIGSQVAIALSGGNTDRARSLWGESGGAVGKANIARFSHALLLHSDPQMENIQAWVDSFKAWAEVLASDDLWSRLMDSEASSGFDPAATVSEVNELRKTAWNLVLDPSLSLVQEAADAEVRLKRHVDVLRSAGWPLNFVLALESNFSEGMESEVYRLAESIDEELEKQLPSYANPDNKTQEEMAKAKAACDKAVDSFRQRVSPCIGKVKGLGAGPSAQRSLDRIARLLKNVAVTYSNDAKEYGEAELLLVEADGLVSDTATSERVRADLNVIRSNIKDQKFWAKAGQTIPPPLGTINGFGTILYGKSDKESDYGSFVMTRYIVFLFIPVYPIDRYRGIPLDAGVYRFIAKEPLKTFHYVYRRVMLGLGSSLLIGALSFGLFLSVLRSTPPRPKGIPGVIHAAPTLHVPAPVSPASPKETPRPPEKKSISVPKSSPSLKPPKPVRKKLEPPKPAARDMDKLLATIKANKDVLLEKEKRIEGLQADIKALENELKRVEVDINQMKARGGVDKTIYTKRVAKYNMLVEYVNDQADKLKNEVSAYQTLLKDTNRMVNEYNGRIKAQ